MRFPILRPLSVLFSLPLLSLAQYNFDASLVPAFGVTPGQYPDGTGNCRGLNWEPIPCTCPPDMGTFLWALDGFLADGNVYGNPISFPCDGSAAAAVERAQALVDTIQNFDGPGVGCPADGASVYAQDLVQAKKEAGY